MNFSTLNQIIVAIREIEPSRGLLLFGSSSLLASFPNQTPETLGVEVTIDADLFLDPDDEAKRVEDAPPVRSLPPEDKDCERREERENRALNPRAAPHMPHRRHAARAPPLAIPVTSS